MPATTSTGTIDPTDVESNDRGSRDRGGAVRRWVEPALVVLGVVLTLELITRLGILDRSSVPPPTEILQSLRTDVSGDVLWPAIGTTLSSWAYGLLLACLIGIPLGLALGSSVVLYRSTHLTLEFIRNVPILAAFPFLVLVFGVTFKLTVILVVLSATWPILLQTMYGVHDVDPVMHDTASVYGLGRIGRLRRVTIPSALPNIFTGLRLGGVLGLLVVVATSIFVGGEGLGATITSAANSARPDLMYARIFATGLLGVAVSTTLVRLERWTLPWHVANRAVA